MSSIQIENMYNDSCMDDNSYEGNISIINDIETYAVNDAFYIEYTVDNSCTYALDAYDSTNTYNIKWRVVKSHAIFYVICLMNNK